MQLNLYIYIYTVKIDNSDSMLIEAVVVEFHSIHMALGCASAIHRQFSKLNSFWTAFTRSSLVEAHLRFSKAASTIMWSLTRCFDSSMRA